MSGTTNREGTSARVEAVHALRAHSMTGWLEPVDVPLPALADAPRLVWCGIGGSLLPSRALVHALADEDTGRRFVPLASPEPSAFRLRSDDQLVFASKSGRTLELWTWISRLAADPIFARLARKPIVVTQDDENPLARWARARAFPILPIPVEVGGRFSAFTPIGTLPIAFVGGAPEAYLEGGRSVARAYDDAASPWSARIDAMVETLVGSYADGIVEWALFPYAQRLSVISDWWVQLVAESLGKERADARRVGLTPIRGVGPDDQHAQLQRWMAGPRNLGVIVLTTPRGGAEPLVVPGECPFPGLAQLGGADVLAAQAEGTIEALRAAGVPVVHWELPAVDSRSLGELMMAWQIVVGRTGLAWGIDPFDQPAVEDGKKRTMRKLGLG